MKRSPYAKPFREFRADLGFNQTEMAKALACEQSTISRLERGRLQPPLKTLELAYCLAWNESNVSNDDTAALRMHSLFMRHLGGVNG